MSYDRKQIILERNDRPEGLGGKHVDIYDFPDGRLDGPMERSLASLGILSKDQRVSHTAVVENKRLGMRWQDAAGYKHAPNVKTNSEKIGYRMREKMDYGPPEMPVNLAPGRQQWKMPD
jgi:hypothetical protein